MSTPDAVETKVARSAGKKRNALHESVNSMPLPNTQEVKKEPNPFVDRDWRMFIYAWSGMFVRIALILGAVFSVYQFLAAREEKRVERALELVELWEQPEYQVAQRALKTRIADLNERYAELIGDRPSASEQAAYAERIGIEALSASGGSQSLSEFQEQFDRIIYFFNRVAFCVEGNLCSREVADAYFKDFAVSFWSYFTGYIAVQRKSFAPNYAAPIEQYVHAPSTVAAP